MNTRERERERESKNRAKELTNGQNLITTALNTTQFNGKRLSEAH
jgi:hypothetical protein